MGLKVTTARTRLGQISHHFLSDQLSSGLQESEPFILSILTHRQEHGFFPVDALTHALLIRGLCPITLNTDYGSPTVCRHTLVKNKPVIYNRSPDNKSTKALNINKLEEHLDKNTHKKTDICFMPVNSPDSQYLGLSDVIITPVTASIEGIQDAYSLIKKASARREGAIIGATIIDAKDHTHAQQCFDKLAIAVKQFLNLDIISYGYLPVFKTSGRAFPQHDEHSLYPLCISGIVDLITLDRKEWLVNKDSSHEISLSSERLEQRLTS